MWLVWFIVWLTAVDGSGLHCASSPAAPLLGIVSNDASRSGPLFPWQARTRWKKWALHRHLQWRSRYRRPKLTVQLARLALGGMMTMAEVVNRLTAGQMRYKLGALPVLYGPSRIW